MKKFLLLIIILLIAAYLALPMSPWELMGLVNDEPMGIDKAAHSTEPTTEFVPLSTEEMSSCSSPEQWRRIMDSAVYSLMDSVSINISGYSDRKYDLESLPYGIAIKSTGHAIFGKANIKYDFTYNSDFKLIATSKNSELYDRLDEDEKRVFDILKAECESINRQTDTQYGREVLIHNYLTKNHRYSEFDTVSDRAHSIVGLITDKTGVCQAYADAFEVMCNLCGIECINVLGELDGVSHGWNIVKIDGDYYHVDVTSDDPTPDSMTLQHYDYLNLTDEEIKKTHKITTKGLPECTATRYNYFILNGLVVHNASELETVINNAKFNKRRGFTFKTNGYIITDTNQIARYFDYSGYTNISVSGSFGQDGVFCIFLG